MNWASFAPIELALSIDGKPWKFQPDETDPTPGNLSDFLTAHDILCHSLSQRNRTILETNPIGEICTGHSSGNKTILPSTPSQYDGIVFNIADARIKKETGANIFDSFTRLESYNLILLQKKH